MKQYSKKNRTSYLSGLAAILVSTVFSVVLQFFKGDVLDAALAGETTAAVRWAALLLVFILGESLFYYLYACLAARFVTGCTRMLKQDIFKSILRRSYVSYKQHPQGWYVSKYTNEADNIQESYFQMLPLLGQILLKVTFVGAALFLLDTRIAVLTLVLLTTPLYLPKLIEKQLQNAQQEKIRAVEAVLTRVQNWLSGFEILKNFSVEQNVFQKFGEANNRAMKAMYRNAAWRAKSQLLTSLISYLSYFVILAFSAFLVWRGDFSAGDFFVAIGMIDQLSYPLISLADILRALISIRPACQSMQRFLAEGDTPAGTHPLRAVHREICYDAVTFAYPGASRPILQDVTYTMRKGCRYLLKGPSGCGKTTAVNLLLRYYDVDSGRITADGVPLSDYDSTYGCVTVVRQDAVLFHDSLRNNLTLYQDVAEEKLLEALHAVELDKFASREALASVIAENGANLSGGEKKRICLARALLRDTDVLILDEPLANLDAATAARIEDLLLSIRGKIVLVVSHQFTQEKLRKFDGVIEFHAAAEAPLCARRA
ncbi:ABC transporter ATP-binding protein [uncultured Gemmiger sp.]|uniref:ABC transporter ATP-binding protein n=1 Tax=uncultured Gemmiger sp. TaxID=1623490 RepID=UPI0025EE8B3E|nr:ABC transporter ATP-binding protein [uncultured Gemmiger sp.]